MVLILRLGGGGDGMLKRGKTKSLKVQNLGEKESSTCGVSNIGSPNSIPQIRQNCDKVLKAQGIQVHLLSPSQMSQNTGK